MFADRSTIVGRSILEAGRRIAARLAMTIDDLGPVDQDPEDVRRRACAILDRPCTPYEPPAPTEPPSLDLPFAKVLATILLLALVVGLLALVIRSVRRVRWSRSTTAEATEEMSTSERIIDTSRSPDVWRAAAAEHAAAGRYREALRCRYRALVGDLARRGLLDEIPGRTTGEERTQLATLAPGSSPAFSRASSMFDQVWYGAAEVSRADHDRFIAEEDAVLAGTAQRPGSGRR